MSDPINFPKTFKINEDTMKLFAFQNTTNTMVHILGVAEDLENFNFKTNCMVAFEVLYTCIKITEHFHTLFPSDGSQAILNELKNIFSRLKAEVSNKENCPSMMASLEENVLINQEKSFQEQEVEAVSKRLKNLFSLISQYTKR